MKEITRELFGDIINEIKKVNDYQDGLNDFFYKNDVDGYIYQPNCIDTLLKILNFIFDDKNNWIGYFCFEINFGKKYQDGMIKDENGENIPLATVDDLYNLLTK